MKVAIANCQTSTQDQDMQRAFQNQLNNLLIHQY